jgi:hypothetical protein
MKPITFSHKYDPDLKITVALPAGQAGEDAYADWCNARARGQEYQAAYDLTRACAVEPTDAALSDLLRVWSGVATRAADAIIVESQDSDAELLDPREVVANYDKHKDAVGMPALATIEQWIRQYPRKGPPGEAQCGLAKFDWGVVPYRSPEPTEWFAVEQMRAAKLNYQVLRSFVQSCVLSDVAPILERGKSKPGLIVSLGAIIRGAAGEEFAKRMGE